MPYTKESVADMVKMLTNRLWREVSNIGYGTIGTCYPDLGQKSRDFTDNELTAYMEGVANVLAVALESLQGNAEFDEAAMKIDAGSWIDQLRGALGEQLRRRHLGERCCQGRKLNAWLTEIRDRRIALLDEYQDEELQKWIFDTRRQLDRWCREYGAEENWSTTHLIRSELDGLYGLFWEKRNDRDWYSRKFQRREELKRQAAAAPTTEASEI